MFFKRLNKAASRALAVSCVVILGGLSACETPTLLPTYAEPTWTHMDPITFKAGGVELQEDYIAPLKSPNLDHEFPVIPKAAMQRWVLDRLQANARTGDNAGRIVRVIIRDASAIGVPLKTKDGVVGLFYKEQAFRIKASLEAIVEVRNGRGFVSSTARVQVKRTRTVPEETSPNSLDAIYHALLKDLMTDFNLHMELEIRKHMAKDLG